MEAVSSSGEACAAVKSRARQRETVEGTVPAGKKNRQKKKNIFAIGLDSANKKWYCLRCLGQYAKQKEKTNMRCARIKAAWRSAKGRQSRKLARAARMKADKADKAGKSASRQVAGSRMQDAQGVKKQTRG